MERSTRLLFRLPALLLSALLIGACQHKPAPPTRPTLQEYIASGQANVQRHVGVMTFDRALQEWGQPVSVVEGERVTSAVWRTVNTPAQTIIVPAPVTHGLSPLFSTVPAYVDMPSHGDQVDCTFSKSTGLLQTIRYSAW